MEIQNWKRISGLRKWFDQCIHFWRGVPFSDGADYRSERVKRIFAFSLNFQFPFSLLNFSLNDKTNPCSNAVSREETSQTPIFITTSECVNSETPRTMRNCARDIHAWRKEREEETRLQSVLIFRRGLTARNLHSREIFIARKAIHPSLWRRPTYPFASRRDHERSRRNATTVA